MERQYTLPHELYYQPEHHLWLREEDGLIRIGLDALGLESLGEMALLELPPEGQVVERGEVLGSLEAAKMVSELVSPISGRVAARNEALAHDPARVNRDPYGQGWLVLVEPSRWPKEADHLIHGPQDVDRWAAAEVERYRDLGWI